jgi:hypothetical protein
MKSYPNPAVRFLNDFNSPACQQCIRFVTAASSELDGFCDAGPEGYRVRILYVCMYVCMYFSMYVCSYACMYVCSYVLDFFSFQVYNPNLTSALALIYCA